MKIKNLVARTAVLVGAVGVLVTGTNAQDKLPRGTKSGFVVTADRVRIHYLEAGPAGTRPGRSTGRSKVLNRRRNETPTILFVPGLMTPGWIWEHQIAHFARHYRVVAMDPRSQGQSSTPTEGHYPAARARDIKAVVDKLGLAPVVIVGYTSAVTEAVSYVDQFGTGTLAGLVLVHGIAGREYDQATLSSLTSYANGLQLDRQKATERMVRGLYKKQPSEAYIRRMIRETSKMPTNSAVALIVGGVATDNRPALAAIDKPTLIVVARNPPWMQFFDDLHRRIRGARMEVFDDAGHALFVDEAARFNTLLDDFLSELERTN